MTDNERILENVNATMQMEDFYITENEKELILDCLNGTKDFETEIESIIQEFSEMAV